MNKIINHYLTPINALDCHIKVKTTPDIQSIIIYYGDPHDYKKINDTTYKWNHQEVEMSLDQTSIHNHYFSATITNKNKRFKYYYKLIMDDSTIFYGQKGYFKDDTNLDIYATFYFPYLHEHEIFSPTSWVKDQIWCQIFVDRFRKSPQQNQLDLMEWESTPVTNKKHYGGDLQGIISELDHLKELGFTGLYLTPIFKSPSTHKYNTTDYFEIDEFFGNKEDLKQLVEACHQRDMKIILDAVFNHSGTQFKPFKDVLEKKEQSKYKDWFHIQSFDPFEYETFSIVKDMPKLNTNNPEVQETLLSVLHYYLKEFNIDGWRFDVANELDHTFIRRINQEIKRDYPSAYLLAEIWHDPIDFVGYNQFDGIMEYEKAFVFNEFLNETISIDETIGRLSDINYRTPINTQQDQFNLIDSHDTKRLINMVNHDQDKALMALMFLSLQKGSICLFYGTHYFLEGENDPYCRVCYPLNPTHEQLESSKQVKNILDFRKQFNHIINYEDYRLEKSEQALLVHFSLFTIKFDLNSNTYSIIWQQ